MSTWDAWRERWTQKWREVEAGATQKYQQVVQDRWSDYKATVEGTVNNLNAIEALLVATSALVDEYAKLGGQYVAEYRNNLDAISREYHNLAAGVFTGATPASPESRGAPAPSLGSPVVIFVVGAVALTLVAVCFAIAVYPYSNSLLETAQAQHDEVAGRVEAMRKGTSLQPSTIPPKDDTVSYLVLGGVALVSAAAVFYAMKKPQ